MRFKLLALTCVIAASMLAPQTSFAQSDLKKSTVVFDLRLNMMRNGKTMKGLGIDGEMLKKMTNANNDVFDIAEVDRIFGAMTMPESVQGFAAMQNSSEDLPIDFFVQVKFKDAKSAKANYERAEGDSEKETIGGKTYIRPPNSPKNIVAQMYDDTTMEIGTKKYILQSSRNNELFSEGLNAAWKQAPNHSIRIAIDLDGERKLINEAVAMAKQQMPDPTLGGMLELINNARNLRLSIDMDDATMFELGATGVSEEDAETLREGLGGLLTIAKMGGGQAASQIPDPNAKALAKEVLGSLSSKRSGNEVKIAIPRPKTLDAALKSAMEVFKSMQGG